MQLLIIKLFPCDSSYNTLNKLFMIFLSTYSTLATCFLYWFMINKGTHACGSGEIIVEETNFPLHKAAVPLLCMIQRLVCLAHVSLFVCSQSCYVPLFFYDYKAVELQGWLGQCIASHPAASTRLICNSIVSHTTSIVTFLCSC